METFEEKGLTEEDALVNARLAKILTADDYDFNKKRTNLIGPPPPITELTMEQDLKLRQIEIGLNNPDTDIKDIITVFLALQKQNFVLTNSINNLLKKWPKPPVTMVRDIIGVDPSNPGILYVTRD